MRKISQGIAEVPRKQGTLFLAGTLTRFHQKNTREMHALWFVLERRVETAAGPWLLLRHSRSGRTVKGEGKWVIIALKLSRGLKTPRLLVSYCISVFISLQLGDLNEHF